MKILNLSGKTIFENDSDDLVDANLRGANLSGANLCGANLDGANLYGANLVGANLSGANLIGANLIGANLIGANLIGANLYGANLVGANLSGANLIGANLSDANLDGANLDGANLYGANLYGANLYGANLSGADLRDANLIDANLDGAKNSELALSETVIVPDGDIIGWKKCRNGVIVKLKIPAAAKRSNATGRKCRAEFAEVLEVIGAEVGYSENDENFAYRVGETVKPYKPFCEDRFTECASGIHFFITRAEAENYY